MIFDFINGVWAIERGYAEQYRPIVSRILSGNSDLTNDNLLKRQTELEAPVYHSINNSDSTGESSTSGKVAVLSYKSAIVKYSTMCGPRGTEAFAAEIRSAANDPSVRAIIIDMDSGGGAANAVANPRSAILEAREKKPVIGYAGNGMVASAAYGIMSACTEIYATYANDQIGSIGSYITLLDYEEAMSKELQARVESIYASQSTAKNDYYRAWKAGDKSVIQNMIDQFNAQFIADVKEARGPKLKDDVFDGRLVNADEAVSFGLIDGMKSFAQVIDRAFELAVDKQQQQQTQMKILVQNMDKTIDAINAGATASPEQISEANTELSQRGLMLVNATDQVDAADLQQQIENLTTANTALQNRVTELTTERNAIATSVGLTVAENGDLIDQNNDPVQLIDSVHAVVDQRDAYGRQAGVIGVAAVEHKEIDSNDEPDPSLAYLEEKFPNQ